MAVVIAASCCVAVASAATYPAGPQITDRYAPGAVSIRLVDAFVAPKSATGSGATTAQIARVNFLRTEPIESLAAGRVFANDMNGTLAIVDRSTGSFSTYLNFDTIFTGSTTGDFDADPGYAAGLVTMQFDPDYAANGKFYTVHTELGSGSPTQYRQAVLTEWQDTDITNTTFSGSRAELLRVAYSNGIHPLGDIAFNPAAHAATHPDWRTMYVTSGDGGSGESGAPLRDSPQRLDSLLGKVLRIRTNGTGVTGTYTVPTDNPYAAGPAGAHPAVFATGLRNPHRMTWDLDDQGVSRGFIGDIGLHSYEEVNLLQSGANYGYSRIEGNQVLETSNSVSAAALPATLPLLTGTGTVVGSVAPTYPLAAYSHRDGDAVSGGFVYRGQAIPALRGKFVFGDLTTGRLFFSDLAEMLAANDGNPDTMAAIHELNVFYDDPTTPAAAVESRRVFDIVRDRWDLRNETATGATSFDGIDDGDGLPGGAAATGRLDPYGVAYGGGRADIRLAVIDDELFVISKSDGMVRQIVNAVGDANFDGLVGLSDLTTLATAYGGGGTFAQGDFNLDGQVDRGDVQLLASAYVATGGTDITPASLAGFSSTLATDWQAAVAAAPPPPTITVDVPIGMQTQSQAGRRLLDGFLAIAKTGSGTLVLDRPNTLTGTTTVAAGRMHLAHRSALTASTLVPLTGGTVTLAPGLAAMVNRLDPVAGGVIDLGAGSISVAAGVPSIDALVALAAGRGDGTWNGAAGIVSSSARASIAAGEMRSVGWRVHDDGSTTFSFAAPGDTNLDGLVDILDAADFAGSGRFDSGLSASWQQGDFGYDGLVDILDAADLLATDLFDAGTYAGVGNAPTVAVPEPALTIAGCVALAMLLMRGPRSRR